MNDIIAARVITHKFFEMYGTMMTMFTIVGLGNPGEEYANTRHNAGWIVLQHFLKAHELLPMTFSKMWNGEIAEGTVNNERVTVFFPHTFMNNSGAGIQKVLSGASHERLIVVADEIDLGIGDMKISYGKGSGGHNGIQSIINALGSKDFARIRVGIARKNIFGALSRPRGDRLSDFVLSPFSSGERTVLADVASKVTTALEMIVSDGVERAMNTYNSEG